MAGPSLSRVRCSRPSQFRSWKRRKPICGDTEPPRAYSRRRKKEPKPHMSNVMSSTDPMYVSDQGVSGAQQLVDSGALSAGDQSLARVARHFSNALGLANSAARTARDRANSVAKDDTIYPEGRARLAAVSINDGKAK